MKVKDIVYSAAKSLGVYEEIAAYFEKGEETLKREGELLLECFNRVESALALEYLPLYAEDTVLTVQDRLEYSALKYSPVRILGVENGAGEGVNYKLCATYLKAPAGKLKVTYSYTPDKKDIEGDSEFNLQTAPAMLTHGVLAEYCTAEGRLQEAAAWEKKYKEGIAAAFRGQASRRIGSRKWV